MAYIAATGNTTDLSDLYEEMTTAMLCFDLLVFVPVEEPDVIGCPESDLPDLRQEVHHTLEDWMGDLDLNILEVSGTIENRKQQLLDKLRHWENA